MQLQRFEVPVAELLLRPLETQPQLDQAGYFTNPLHLRVLETTATSVRQSPE